VPQITRRGLIKAALTTPLLATGAYARAVETAQQDSTWVQNARRFRPIATEEAFTIPEVLAEGRKLIAAGVSGGDMDVMKLIIRSETFSRKLQDLESERLSVMDDNGIAMQLLSLSSPGVQVFSPDIATGLAQVANDRLAEAISQHPTRYAGLASFAPHAPQQAVREIERAIRELKLNGLIVNSHTNGEYLDDPKYRPILELIAELGVPLYIHPRVPPPAMSEPLQPDLNLAIWGFKVETGLHAMRLILSGIFDELPNLKIILGHCGEGIPFWLHRLDTRYGDSAVRRNKLQRKPSEYFRDNFAVTTSGMHWNPVLKYCVEVLGIANVMFAVDYPFENTTQAVQGLLSADFSDAEKGMIFHRNAANTFSISPLDASPSGAAPDNLVAES